ncbi:MAG: TerB family tellurite resistance protein [Cyclobacteriaceae bacterium]|nr:TerB family tellurite resistance protein [Cyclobacteriaceae bacterium]
MDKKINPHLNILVHLAKVDGSADGSELELIRQIGNSHNISDKDIDFAIKTAEESNFVTAVENFPPEEKLELVYNLALVTLADGIVHTEEVRFCVDIIKKMGFSEKVLFDLVDLIDPENIQGADKEALLKIAKENLLK